MFDRRERIHHAEIEIRHRFVRCIHDGGARRGRDCPSRRGELYTDAAPRREATYGHGCPFVYARFEKGEPTLTFAHKPQVWSGDAEAPVLGVSIEGRHYGLFGPMGATWMGLDTNKLTCKTGGKSYFSVALLPTATAETLALFRRHAYAHATGTKVEWNYEPKTSTVAERFTFTTKPYEGDENTTLFALYPHQWRHTSTKLLDLNYDCVRGKMKLAADTSFSTRRTFPGVLIALPDCDEIDKKKLKQYVEDEASILMPDIKDTYWTGKRLGKIATLIPPRTSHVLPKRHRGEGRSTTGTVRHDRATSRRRG